MPVDRPRDLAGRPRNSRERDAAGRPLPHGVAGVDRVPEDLVLPPREALTEAQRLIDAGQPFSAHEVLEGSWKAAPPAEKALWRALAQLAVGLTHAQRGNPVGAATLLTRGAAGLQALADVPTAAGTSAEVGRTPAGPGPYDIAVEQLVRDATRLADLAATGRSFAPTLRLLC